LITIFSPHITARLLYVLDFCFGEKGQIYEVYTNEEEFESLSQKDLNYSNQSLNALHTILPQGLLFESDIHSGKLITKDGSLFKIDGVNDELSLIFYFLSRYEEYGLAKKDKHGRMRAEDNVLVQLKVHKSPIVDRMVKSIWEKLSLGYDGVKQQFKLIPSFDIDVAWAYKNRKFIRLIGAFVKGGKPIQRLGVLAGIKKDPYDTYAEMRKIAVKTDQFLTFILLGDWGPHDKNIHWQNLAYGSLIRGLNLEGEVGIHPSYGSHSEVAKVANELSRLAEITGHEINLSRQHFLKFEFPKTFSLLAKLGITDDYSLGFADEIGFRAGTSFPFFFFDLQKNERTTLRFHPFTYMDSALKDYLKLDPDVAKAEIARLLEEVKSVGGEFIVIWHNSSIHDTGEWKGWKAVLDYTIDEGLK